MNADEDDDITEELLADAEKLTGLSLELLGLDPHPDDMTAEQRLQFDPEDLAEMATASPDERERSVHQTRLLAGLLWNSSSILIDQLFRDLGSLQGLDAKFTQRFIVVASDVTASLARGWTAPGCLAGGLAVHCLLDQARITEDIYELDLPEEWRAIVEEVLLEDADSETLYADGAGEADTAVEQNLGNLDIRHWFEPIAPGDAVPPYACS
jgi:hypothetical protein